jgi:hypothetical protein
VQFDRRLDNGLRVVNAGSVGMPYEGKDGAYWALLGPTVDLRRTAYDVAAAVTTRRGRPGTNVDGLVRRLLEPPGPVEATAHFESLRGA